MSDFVTKMMYLKADLGARQAAHEHCSHICSIHLKQPVHLLCGHLAQRAYEELGGACKIK
jgi:sulfur transfer complex TusBCD TusB component (DsrH family)